jgi:peptide/nickel transport system substrate-binding protein
MLYQAARVEATRRYGLGVARLAAVVIPTILAGGGGCRGEDPATPRVLRVALRADVLGFFGSDPLPSEAFTLQINAQIVEGLVRFDRSLRVRPALAESWETPDDRTYRFLLRPELRFSDGRSLTAEDVAASLELAQSSDWGNQDALQAIESVRVLDPRRLEIRTRFPYRLLLQSLHWGFVLPKEELRRTPVRTIGSGPYRLAERRPGEGFTLERNPFYRGAEPAFERVVFDVVPDAHERIGRLLRGQADVSDGVPPERVAELRAHPELQVHAGPGLRVLYLGLRVDRPPFSDPRVRRAVSLALDREELLTRARLAPGKPAHQLVPSAVVGYDPSFAPPRRDPEAARALLAAAGHGDGLRVRLDGPNNRYANDTLILSEVARQLALAGFQVEVDARDKRQFFALIDSGGSNLHLFGWMCRSGQAADLLEAVLHSKQGRSGSWNSLGLADPALDQLIERVGGSRSEAEWSRTLRSTQRRALESNALVPLVVQPESLALRRPLRWTPSLDYSLWLEDIAPGP